MGAAMPVEPGALDRAAAITQSYDLRTSLPAGVTLSRASPAWFFDAAGVVQAVGSNVPRFGYDSHRPDKGAHLLLEPATTNYARNGAFTGAVVASNPESFNTSTGSNPGTWGTLPGNFAIVTPSGVFDGSTSGWQVAGLGTEDGQPYIDIRLRLTNNAVGGPNIPTTETTKSQRILFTLASGNGIPAAQGEWWTVSGRIRLLSGQSSGTVRLTLRSQNGSTTAQVFDFGLAGELRAPGDVTYASYSEQMTLPCTAMTAGVSVATLAQSSTDITLRIQLPQLERLDAPSSPVITNNAAFVSRAADSLTVATGLGPGTYHVRWIGLWKNYDQAVTTGDGTLVLPIPAGALADGSYLFEKLLVSTQPFAPDDRRLRWAPEPLGPNVLFMDIPPEASYLPPSTTISPITGQPYGAAGSFEANLDVVLRCTTRLTQPLKIVGGRLVRLIGFEIAPNETAADFENTRSTLGLVGCSRGWHIEGGLIDCGGFIQRDAINFEGENPKQGLNHNPYVCVQNVLAINLHGESDQTTIKPDGTRGNHSDVIQPFGRMGDIRVDKLEGTSSYQGVFIPPFFPMGSRTLSRVHMAFKEYPADPVQNLNFPFPFWFGSPPEGPAERVWPKTELAECYSSTRIPPGSFTGNGAWPYPNFVVRGVSYPEYSAQPGEDGLSLAWPPAMRIKGCIRKGPPPGGAFVKPTDCGLSYKSPGYGYVP